uniref:uncharacterized protein LOC120340662 n=1 Tax=Styela clava TaxID=7725 RepID=UPI00193A591C|nr:uncharacterized protein LOC120340662 [Styela clava]
MGTMKKSVQCVDDAKSGPHSFESYEDMMNKFIYFNSICSYRWRKTQHQGKMYLKPEEFHIVMKSKRNLSWSSRGRKAKGVTLEFDGIPYVIIGREFFTCHQGPDVDRLQKAKKRKLEETKINQDPTYSIKRRTNFQTTKKKNCPATVEMLYIVKILNLKISKDNRWDRALAAQNFHTKYDWDFKHEYHIYLPSKMEHKGHPIIKEDCKYLSHLLKDSKVENNINIVVSKDYTNSYINQPHKGGPLESAIVESEEANVLLEVQNDEMSLEEKCKELTSDANYFVRENDNANGTNFLFVYQCHWQKRLLSLYGNEVCFVDAGHRTCNFSLRTFFLRVKTNVCHIVVGLFICEKEDNFSIKEALSKLSCWNEKWAPKNFLTDYATLKSQGISSVFPKSNVNLSDYYREKEWSEWLCQEENCLRDSSIEILKLVRAIARTTSVCSYEIAKKQLQQSSIWTESLVLQAYYNTVWQPVEDKWVQGFRDESKNILVLSKVGSEKENDWIKNSKLPDCCELPVIRLFEVLVNEFFPEKL